MSSAGDGDIEVPAGLAGAVEVGEAPLVIVPRWDILLITCTKTNPGIDLIHLYVSRTDFIFSKPDGFSVRVTSSQSITAVRNNHFDPTSRFGYP